MQFFSIENGFIMIYGITKFKLIPSLRRNNARIEFKSAKKELVIKRISEQIEDLNVEGV